MRKVFFNPKLQLKFVELWEIGVTNTANNWNEITSSQSLGQKFLTETFIVFFVSD